MTIKISFASIEKAYGKDSIDNAADDIYCCVKQVEDYPEQISFSMDLDTVHDNPWYHTLVLNITTATEKQFDDLLRKIQDLKLNIENPKNA
jgi:hypothetical protein